MNKCIKMALFAGTITLLAIAAQADWDPGDPFKMHYPQLPDPIGWDVAFSTTLADDFLCTESGAISDIHLWTSWREDNVDWAAIQNIHLSIHSDIPAGQLTPWSQPGALLWETDIGQNFVTREYGLGTQSWYDPLNAIVTPNDHQGIWQINIMDIQNPFVQQQGTIYWLDVRVDMLPTGAEMGWKTTQDHWNDDGVFDVGGFWEELRDPLTTESLDFAFVVPEPSVISLFGLMGAGMLFIRRVFLI